MRVGGTWTCGQRALAASTIRRRACGQRRPRGNIRGLMRPGLPRRASRAALALLGLAIALVLLAGPARSWEVVGAAVDLAISRSWSDSAEARPSVPWRRVAHAGGAVAGLANTNSLDALDANYAAGHRVFELDLERTTDGTVVALHDWDAAWEDSRPGTKRKGRQDLKAFLSEPTKAGLRPLTWDLVAEWLRRHPDAYLVTDVKGDNLGVLAHVAGSRDLLPRIVPQVYSFAEYRPARALGFSRIFLTLYRIEWGTWSVLRFLRSHPVAGLVCEPARVRRGGLGLRARALGVPVFAHTINDPDEAAALERLGVDGVYTDHLAP